MGITPIVIRRAAYYAALGVGDYYPEHPHYDHVRVEKSYEVTQNAMFKDEWGFGLNVAFYLKGRRIRWVEFGCRTVGAGGDTILNEVSDADARDD